MFGLRLILDILYFVNVSLLFLIAFDAVVNAGGGSWWLMEERLVMHESLVVDGVVPG